MFDLTPENIQLYGARMGLTTAEIAGVQSIVHAIGHTLQMRAQHTCIELAVPRVKPGMPTITVEHLRTALAEPKVLDEMRAYARRQMSADGLAASHKFVELLQDDMPAPAPAVIWLDYNTLMSKGRTFGLDDQVLYEVCDVLFAIGMTLMARHDDAFGAMRKQLSEPVVDPITKVYTITNLMLSEAINDWEMRKQLLAQHPEHVSYESIKRCREFLQHLAAAA